jgi:hypothetical protein
MRAMPRNAAWRRIRTLRSRPPGQAAHDEARRRVFGAALEQSEELFDAAAITSEAAKPLPLFYALSQAGQALAAAYNREPGWRITGHGLRVRVDDSGLPSVVVTPAANKNRSDAYSSVARALGSDVLHGRVTLAELWAAVPDLLDYRHLASDATAALEIRPDGANPNVFPVLRPAIGTVLVADVDGEEELRARLGRFARTEGCEVLLGPLPSVEGFSQATLHWPAEPPPDAMPGIKAFRLLDDVALRVDGRWFLQPLLGTRPAAPDPLLVWWAPAHRPLVGCSLSP